MDSDQLESIQTRARALAEERPSYSKIARQHYVKLTRKHYVKKLENFLDSMPWKSVHKDLSVSYFMLGPKSGPESGCIYFTLGERVNWVCYGFPGKQRVFCDYLVPIPGSMEEECEDKSTDEDRKRECAILTPAQWSTFDQLLSIIDEFAVVLKDC